MPTDTEPTRLKTRSTEYKALTEKLISSAHSRKKEYFIRDTKLKGFYVRVKPSGHRAYGVNARLNGTGKFIQKILGDRTRYTLQEARVKAKEWLRLISEA